MKISVLTGFTAALIASTAMAASHPALLTGKQAHLFVTGAPPGSTTLYDQNKDPSGVSVFSQYSESGYDTQAADDFTVPNGHKWTIKEVDVTGVYFNGYGPASSENVVFYKDNNGAPGNTVAECPNQSGADNGTGSFAIRLSKACTVKLNGGKTYWVSVQAVLNFIDGGEWGWSLSTDTSGNPAVWEDGQTCPTWCSLGSDLMFALRGKDKG